MTEILLAASIAVLCFIGYVILVNRSGGKLYAEELLVASVLAFGGWSATLVVFAGLLSHLS